MGTGYAFCNMAIAIGQFVGPLIAGYARLYRTASDTSAMTCAWEVVRKRPAPVTSAMNPIWWLGVRSAIWPLQSVSLLGLLSLAMRGYTLAGEV
jgi:hypothetical protein